jgi:hypothetical protein
MNSNNPREPSCLKLVEQVHKIADEFSRVEVTALLESPYLPINPREIDPPDFQG